MAGSGKTVGLILLIAGVMLGIGSGAWLLLGVDEGKTERSGAVLGFILLFGVIVLPLVLGGAYLMVRGRSETKDLANVGRQRRLLDIVQTRGTIAISELVLELDSTREQVQRDLEGLVGRGLFTGYVDHSKGILYSVEASKLQGSTTCPNCGGELKLAGKGLVKCPYCGAEIYL